MQFDPARDGVLTDGHPRSRTSMNNITRDQASQMPPTMSIFETLVVARLAELLCHSHACISWSKHLVVVMVNSNEVVILLKTYRQQ